MVKKLISHLHHRTAWRLGLKSFGWLFGLLLSAFLGSPLWLGVLLVCYLGWLYVSSKQDANRIKTSFWTLGIISLWGLYRAVFVPLPFLSILGLSFISSVFLFVILGLRTLFFKHPDRTYAIFQTTFVLGVFASILFFVHTNVYGEIIYIPLSIFLISALCAKEAYEFYETGVLQGRRALAYGGFLGLFVTEIAWIGQFLPLTFLGLAAFLTLVFVVGRDSLYEYLKGGFTKDFMLKMLTFFMVVGIIIFASTVWSL